MLSGLAVLLLLGGCAETEDARPVQAIQRLELIGTGSPSRHSNPSTVRRWENFADGEPWSSWEFHGTKHSVITFEDQPLLRIARKEEVLVDIPVEATLHQDVFLTADLLMRVHPTRLSAELLRGDERVAIEQLCITGSDRLQSVVFGCASTPEGLGEIDRIVLRISPGTEPVGIRSLVLEQGTSPAASEPRSLESFELITSEGDARRATYFSQTTTWKAAFEHPGPEWELCFSYGQPDHVHLPGQQPELRVTLEYPAGREDEQILQIRPGPGATAAWQHACLPLRDSPDGQVTATFRLHCSDGTGLVALGQPCLVRRSDEADTVLLITSDTHRADHVGFIHEEGELVTDTIDRLAAAGVSFIDAQSTVNNTTPAHVSLFTGLSPRDTGMVYNVSRLSDKAPTLAEAFHDAGYATLASVSAPPVDFNYCGLDQGFDRYSIPHMAEVRGSRGTLDQVLEWLPHYDDVPLFVWVHLFDAHAPYEPPDELERRYYPADADPFDVNGQGALPQYAPYWNQSIADPDYTEGLYKGEITGLDQELGKLLAVDRIWNGVIAFTADHGEQLRYGNQRPYDHRGLSLGTLAVPLILRAPGLAPGTRRDDPVQLIDIGRTLLDLTENGHVEFPGRDLLEGRVEVGAPRFAMEANGWAAAVLTDRWMLVLRLAARTFETAELVPEELHRVELYDMKEDPHCQFNVWEQHPEITRKHRKLLIGWLGRSAGHNWRGQSTASEEEVMGALADLGYVAVAEVETSVWFDTGCRCDWCRRFD